MIFPTTPMIGAGSPVDVMADTAYQAELDALQIRTSAAREAWGYTTAGRNEALQAMATRKLGVLATPVGFSENFRAGGAVRVKKFWP